MRTAAPALLPVLRSRMQGQVLFLLLSDEREWTSADLARAVGEPEASVHRETRRLLESGLLTGRQVGRALALRPDESNPAVAPLRQLLIVTFGPGPMVADALRDVAGIQSAYIFGSWAARFAGEPGRAPGDIDVLVVGEPPRGAVDTVLEAVENRVRREINVTFVTARSWYEATDPFVRRVQGQALLRLDVVEKEHT